MPYGWFFALWSLSRWSFLVFYSDATRTCRQLYFVFLHWTWLLPLSNLHSGCTLSWRWEILFWFIRTTFTNVIFSLPTASNTLFLSLFLVLCWRRRHHHLETILPTNNLGNAVVNAEAGQIQAERLAIASDGNEGSEPNQDGFQEQELNSVHDQWDEKNGNDFFLDPIFYFISHSIYNMYNIFPQF